MAKSKAKKPKISIATVQKKEPEVGSLFNPKPSPALLDFVSKDTLLTNSIKEEEAYQMGTRKDTFETKMFMTDGNGRVLSRSEEKKVFEDAEQEVRQKEYDEIFGIQHSMEKKPKSLIPDSTEIPNLKPSNFDDWEITIDTDNRKFNFYNTRSKAKLNIKFDQLGFKVSRKGENVKIRTLWSYAILKDMDSQGVGSIESHARTEKEIGKSIAAYRRLLQRAFREYLTIRSDSKLFEKIYHNEENTIVYKCNAELKLKTAEDEFVYNTELIDNATTVEYSDAPRRTRESTNLDY